MSAHQQEGFGIQDILYVLFKHKWKIILCSMLGMVAALLAFKMSHPSYETDARMLVRYVIERSAVDPYESREDAGSRSDGSVINTEIEILTSWDLAAEVVRKVGAERILKNTADLTTDRTREESEVAAIAGVLKTLKVSAAKESNVIHASYSNPDPTLAIEVLRELVHRYFDKHLEIHRSIGAFDYVATEAEKARSRLRETEGELDRMKAEAGIMSLEGSTNSLELQRAKANELLLAAEADLVEQKARVESLEAALGTAGTSAENTRPLAKPDAVTISDYAAVVERIRILRQRRMELLTKYTESNTQVALLQQQLGDYEGQRKELLKKFPNLVMSNGEGTIAQPTTDIISEKARLAAALAKVDTLKAQTTDLNLRSEQFASTASKISELERRKQLEDQKYRYLNSSLEKARADTALDPSKMPNISMVQNPSAPVKTYDKLTKELVAGLAGGGIVLGVGLAFLLELVIDRRIKRPIEIEAKLQLPLMLSIPYVKPRDRGRLLLSYQQGMLSYNGNGDHGNYVDVGDVATSNEALREEHFIMPYSEAIRDRILFNFAINNVNHKPKLIGFTALSEGAGTSTLAAGLAKSLAEAEGVKILLVDLNSITGRPDEGGGHTAQSLRSALQFSHGEQFRSDSGSVYFARAAARRNGCASATFMPKHLHDLIPQFQASDYDYIIFDMPPIDQTSPSLVMAGLMDKVMLVLDAESTNRESLKWGYSELIKGHADVSCIFNKTRLHAPRWVVG